MTNQPTGSTDKKSKKNALIALYYGKHIRHDEIAKLNDEGIDKNQILTDILTLSELRKYPVFNLLYSQLQGASVALSNCREHFSDEEIENLSLTCLTQALQNTLQMSQAMNATVPPMVVHAAPLGMPTPGVEVTTKPVVTTPPAPVANKAPKPPKVLTKLEDLIPNAEEQATTSRAEVSKPTTPPPAATKSNPFMSNLPPERPKQ